MISPRNCSNKHSSRSVRGRRIHAALWCLALPLLLLATGVAPAAQISVFAAASLVDSLKELAASYEKQSGNKVVLNFGASSTLARQIEEGAPADIFFSADETWMDRLEKSGRILKGTRQDRLSNTLVVVVPLDSALDLRSAQDLMGAGIKRLALADPRAVPAGIYARGYLEKLGLWPRIGPKVVPTENVRAALEAVESADAQAGMVYKTDASISKRVKIAFEIPRAEGPDISYPMGVVSESKQPAEAKQLLKYLGSEEAGKVFEKFGFLLRK